MKVSLGNHRILVRSQAALPHHNRAPYARWQRGKIEGVSVPCERRKHWNCYALRCQCPCHVGEK